ncbi:MAG: trimethylamine methyltransferase family protein [Candidatus Helarchaeota archaeon]|nr:trimethylamine methyltransferase family protein [Candidatus Helarchaeota archaeon]
MRPVFQLLNKDEIEEIYLNALNLLEDFGIYFEKRESLDLFKKAGCKIDIEKKIVYIPRSLVEESLKSVPSELVLYNREGKKVISLSGNNTIFNPGSAAINILDGKTLEIRKPVTNDFIDFIKLTDALQYIEAQSTALVVSDVPESIVDRYRLYLVLKNSIKPVITGAFTIEGIHIMKKMLDVVSDGKIAEKPIAIFDCCPSPPLKWSSLTSQNLIDCAKYKLPIELVSMPLAGATAPVTLASVLATITAENLSGIVLSQIVNKGAPIIWGGSSTIMDMRYGTTPMGAIEASMIDCAYAQIGKHLNLPTHAYLGLSDSKLCDYQAGFESGIGIILGAMMGINVISGPGMLDFESCQSMDKLIIDNEICGMAKKLCRGISVNAETIAYKLIEEIGHHDTFLMADHTLKLHRKEIFIPSTIIDRQNRMAWENQGKIPILKRTQQEISKILKDHEPLSLDSDKEKELDNFFKF